MDAVKEGALLRLRPKVMTVSTVVASLLPIMWSHSTGAEVMKPLATPVLSDGICDNTTFVSCAPAKPMPAERRVAFLRNSLRVSILLKVKFRS